MKSLLPDSEWIDDDMASVWRAITPQRRVQIAFEMMASARRILHAAVTKDNPMWDENAVRCEVSRRFAGGN